MNRARHHHSFVRVAFGVSVGVSLALGLLFSSLGVGACDTFGSGGGDPSTAPTNDASLSPDSDASSSSSTDADAPPASGFVVKLVPPHVTADPGDTFPVTIRVIRALDYTGIVQFAISGGPFGVTTTNPAATQGDTSTFDIAFESAPKGPNELTLTATGPALVSGGTAEQRLVKLGMWVGSRIEPDGGAFEVPQFVTNGLDVKVWGAGGGGSYGGAGGLAIARLLVVPNETIFVDVGTPGTYGASSSDGSGGGFSGVRRGPSNYLLIAGGGGGGGSAPGGAGGGAEGETPTDSNGHGGGGTQFAGGAAGANGSSPVSAATAGVMLRGGDAVNYGNATVGGLPGGGKGGYVGLDTNGYAYGAGGGGGGYYGGGGGGDMAGYAGGGGGGSGFISDAGVDGSLVQGGSGKFLSDPDYIDAGRPGMANRPGHVIVRIPKPN